MQPSTRGINPLRIGIPATGKTFLARALAYRVCQAARRVVFTTASRPLNDLAGAEIHGQLAKRRTGVDRQELPLEP